MNEKAINSGDLLLVKQQNTAENGDIVVALIDDEATVKELRINDDNVRISICFLFMYGMAIVNFYLVAGQKECFPGAGGIDKLI